MHEKFRDQNFCETRKGSLQIFWYCQAKKFDKIVIILKSKKFLDTRTFLKHKGPTYEIFRYSETKNFRRKNVIPPLLSKKFFPYQKFSETQKISFPQFFGSVRQKKVRLKIVISPHLIHKIFFDTKTFWKTDGLPYEVFPFGPVRQKIFDGKWWYPPQLLFIKISDTGIFAKNRRALFRSFSALWDKKISTESRDIPSSYPLKFSITESSLYTEVFPIELYRYCETKNFQRKIMVSPSYP